MKHLKIREEDLEERFVRSGGPGGQNVNKVSTCVILKHLPTGLKIRAQEERSQAANRLLARRRLAEKLETIQREQLERYRSFLHRIRRQKQRRSPQAKRRILASKRLHALKKRMRGRPSPEEG